MPCFALALSGRRDSNPRPTAWKAVTLPTELLPQDISDARFSICDRIATTHHFKSAIRNRQSKIPLWAGKDSNLRRRMPSDLQSDAFNHFATCPLSRARAERANKKIEANNNASLSWRADSDRRPADYKSAALPTELRQHTIVPPTLIRFLKSVTEKSDHSPMKKGETRES